MRVIRIRMFMRSVLAMSIMAFSVLAVQAEEYNLMSVEQAKPLIFPQAKQFVAKPFVLNDDQKSLISEATDLKVRFADIPVWVAQDEGGRALGVVVTDRVVGKHEFITYAVGITSDGKATAPFILDFRESYGQQIERDDWRSQFVGKTRHDRLKVGKDIDNISGATLSCVNVTNGIRRMLHTYDLVLSKAGY